MSSHEIQRFPITLRELEVVAVTDLTPHMRRITLGGPQLGAFDVGGKMQAAMKCLGPDDHVKLFFPDPKSGILSLPQQGDGRLHWPEDPPAISREYTPRAFDENAGELVLDFVLHGHGIAGLWAASATQGDRIHVAGPRASKLFPPASSYVLLGDETAIPAIANWLEMMPATTRADVHILAAALSAQIPLDGPPGATVTWHAQDTADTDVLVRLCGTPAPDSFVWAGAERSAITALREHLDQIGHPKELSHVSSYWTLAA
ncbi:siderophore-interacting protein [Paracoccus albus]|uniref:siderophore-interacting protein n=1 Tax=Paracoccus albus TaxID=3017784 RepID=UPI0022F0E94E|nr:siderophore-interacting protein [Paracoccus albus]WBU61663.1 siderophore-interacting protein [Paracoccus albus]